MMQEQNTIGIILLAGGSSSRLGSPKQLLMYEGQTLIKRMMDIASNSDADPLVLVLGANANLVQQEIGGLSHHSTINADWKEGIASSIRAGVNKILQINPLVEGVVLIFCDQPQLSADLINNLIVAHKKTGKPIVTCSYGDTFGPPTLFHKSVFGKLLELQGDLGARNILRELADSVEAISFPGGELDIDTKADYDKISKR